MDQKFLFLPDKGDFSDVSNRVSDDEDCADFSIWLNCKNNVQKSQMVNLRSWLSLLQLGNHAKQRSTIFFFFISSGYNLHIFIFAMLGNMFKRQSFSRVTFLSGLSCLKLLIISPFLEVTPKNVMDMYKKVSIKGQ